MFKLYANYGSVNTAIPIKLKYIQENYVPVFMVKLIDNTTWVPRGSNLHAKMVKDLKGYKKTLPEVSSYIQSTGCDLLAANGNIDKFLQTKFFEQYYFNTSTLSNSEIFNQFLTGASHNYRDIITKFKIRGFPDQFFGLTQGMLSTISNTNKVTSPLILLMINKDYIPILKLQLMLNKPISLENYFQVWINDIILDSPFKKVITEQVLSKFADEIPLVWKSNMNNLVTRYKAPKLDTLADKKEWLHNKELKLRNILYKENNTLKEYMLNESDEFIKDSQHPILQVKKKIVIELVD